MITSALCTSYKQEILRGVHQPGDTYMMALYTSSATLDASTTVYSSTNEVPNGNGYTTGGQALTGFSTSQSGTTAWVYWTTNPSWTSSSITARGALIYNASQGNKAVATLDFGQDYTDSNGTFTVIWPVADATHAIIRLQ